MSLSATATKDLVQATITIAEEVAAEARRTVLSEQDQSLRLIAELADAISTLAVIIRGSE